VDDGTLRELRVAGSKAGLSEETVSELLG